MNTLTAVPQARASLLLVDDDHVLCDVLRRALHIRGFDVSVAHTAEEALRAIDIEVPEYALVDLRLPDRSSLKLLAKLKAADSNRSPGCKPMSVERVEWEHIQRVLHDNDGNISATARALSMHRRTLQRKLQKHPART